jgi:hypothetical protein
MNSENAKKSAIVAVVIHVMENVCDQNIAREILLGLEEEQVPYRLEAVKYKLDTAIATAHRASRKSIFGVGISIAPDMAVLHYRRLSIDKPLLILPIKAGDLKPYRTLGLNAARFIKGRPFDEI